MPTSKAPWNVAVSKGQLHCLGNRSWATHSTSEFAVEDKHIWCCPCISEWLVVFVRCRKMSSLSRCPGLASNIDWEIFQWVLPGPNTTGIWKDVLSSVGAHWDLLELWCNYPKHPNVLYLYPNPIFVFQHMKFIQEVKSTKNWLLFKGAGSELFPGIPA